MRPEKIVKFNRDRSEVVIVGKKFFLPTINFPNILHCAECIVTVVQKGRYL